MAYCHVTIETAEIFLGIYRYLDLAISAYMGVATGRKSIRSHVDAPRGRWGERRGVEPAQIGGFGGDGGGFGGGGFGGGGFGGNSGSFGGGGFGGNSGSFGGGGTGGGAQASSRVSRRRRVVPLSGPPPSDLGLLDLDSLGGAFAPASVGGNTAGLAPPIPRWPSGPPPSDLGLLDLDSLGGAFAPASVGGSTAGLAPPIPRWPSGPPPSDLGLLDLDSLGGAFAPASMPRWPSGPVWGGVWDMGLDMDPEILTHGIVTSTGQTIEEAIQGITGDFAREVTDIRFFMESCRTDGNEASWFLQNYPINESIKRYMAGQRAPAYSRYHRQPPGLL